MNFVKGGFLVGNRIMGNLEESRRMADKEGTVGGVTAQSPEAKGEVGTLGLDEDGPDRSLREVDEELSTVIARSVKKMKGGKKEKIEPGSADVCMSTSVVGTKKLKGKRKREDNSKEHPSSTPSVNKSSITSNSASSAGKADKRRSKEEMKARKAAKRAERAKVTREADTTNQKRESAAVGPATTSPPVSASAPLQVSLTSGRHAVRQRYIAQKRMACMDAQALKEVCEQRACNATLLTGHRYSCSKPSARFPSQNEHRFQRIATNKRVS